MTKYLMFAFLIACGSNHPNPKAGGGSGSAVAECAATDCGAEPPIAPDVCPTGAAVSTTCTRAASGSCERKILCDGKELESAPAPAPAP